MAQHSKTDEPDETDERAVREALRVLGVAVDDAHRDLPDWAQRARQALDRVLDGWVGSAAEEGRLHIAGDRVRAAVASGDRRDLVVAVGRFDTLARRPQAAVRATPPDPPGTLVR